MKSGCATVGCLGALVVLTATAALVLTQPDAQPEPEPRPSLRPRRGDVSRTPTPVPTRDPDRFLDSPGAARIFSRDEDGDRYRLRYGFVDYAGRRHDVTCGIEKAAVERARRAFGWDESEVEAELDTRLQQAVDKEVSRRHLVPYVHIAITGYGDWSWEFRGSSVDDPEAREQIEGLTKWLNDEYPRILRAAESRVFKRHGLLVKGRRLEIDHNGLAQAASEDLAPCYDALVRSAGAIASERYFIGLLLAFFQELTYELPPDKMGRRDVFGLWVPQQVMSEGRGDCDSKAVAFCALWRQRRSRVIVIRVPKHALVGVEAKPGPGESYVRVGNRYFVLCEVAGPGKLPPGGHGIAGSFEYVEIEPGSGG